MSSKKVNSGEGVSMRQRRIVARGVQILRVVSWRRQRKEQYDDVSDWLMVQTPEAR